MPVASAANLPRYSLHSSLDCFFFMTANLFKGQTFLERHSHKAGLSILLQIPVFNSVLRGHQEVAKNLNF